MTRGNAIGSELHRKGSGGTRPHARLAAAVTLSARHLGQYRSRRRRGELAPCPVGVRARSRSWAQRSAAGDADLVQGRVVALPSKPGAHVFGFLRLHLFRGKGRGYGWGRLRPGTSAMAPAGGALHCTLRLPLPLLLPRPPVPAATAATWANHRPPPWRCPQLSIPHLLLEAAHLGAAGAGCPAHPVACGGSHRVFSLQGSRSPLGGAHQLRRPAQPSRCCTAHPLPTSVAQRRREDAAVLAVGLHGNGGCSGGSGEQSRHWRPPT